jgi:hypothetical protein
MKKTLFYFSISAFFFFQPIFLFAQTAGLPFGGYVVVSVPCTCMAPGTVRVQYLPVVLHPVQYPFVFHALLLTPVTIRYAYQQFLVLPPPTAWHLGKFIPGPAPCLVGVPPACAPLLTDGAIFDVGSSFPGHTLVF